VGDDLVNTADAKQWKWAVRLRLSLTVSKCNLAVLLKDAATLFASCWPMSYVLSTYTHALCLLLGGNLSKQADPCFFTSFSKSLHGQAGWSQWYQIAKCTTWPVHTKIWIVSPLKFLVFEGVLFLQFTCEHNP